MENFTKRAVTLFQEKLSWRSQKSEIEALMDVNEKLRRELRKVQRDYQNLEEFIVWLKIPYFIDERETAARLAVRERFL